MIKLYSQKNIKRVMEKEQNGYSKYHVESKYQFLEWQPCYFSAEGYGFYQTNYTIVL